MEATLKKFVEEQYAKVKKSKKSPKNFDIFLENNCFRIDKVSISNAAKASYEGNLNTLYQCRDVVSNKVIEKKNKGKEEKKIPIKDFITLDGIQINQGEFWFYIEKNNSTSSIKGETCPITNIVSLDTYNYLYFSTEEAAQKYLEKQNSSKKSIIFNTDWINPIKLLLNAAEFDSMTYTSNIKGLSKEQFISIQNWVKSN